MPEASVRYAMLGGDQRHTRPGMSLDEIADVLGISRQRCWQIERSAMKKLQAMPEARELLRLWKGERCE